MPKKDSKTKDLQGCCCVESVISVDERGQMILPKEVRAKAGINPGDKLAIVLHGESPAKCIVMIKVEHIAGMIKQMLGPVFSDIVKE